LLIGAFLFFLGPVLFFVSDLWGHDFYKRFFPAPNDPVAFEDWLRSKRVMVTTVGVSAAALSMSTAALFLRKIRRCR
jgi:hypothetical protein